MRRLIVPRVVLGLTLLGTAAASAATPARVEFRNDRLTVDAEESPVAAILEEIKRQSGAEIRGEPPARPVTIDLEAVPLREALERLLGEQSFTLTYGDQGRLKAIELKGGPQAAPAGERPERPARGTTKKEVWDGIANVFWARGPIPVTGRLAEATGAEQVGYPNLMRAASESEDRVVRRQAWRAAMRAVEADVDTRNALITAVGAMDDAELTVFARALAGMTPDGVEDLAKLVARETRVPELRSRARGVLRQLRQERLAAARS